MTPPTRKHDLEKRRCSIEPTKDCREHWPEPAMAISGPKVLVVEDDDSLRAAIGRLLGAAGFESPACASAEAALDGHTGDEPVCVVSDLRLPGMSGFELLDELRRRGWRAPFIAITAHDAPGLGDEALRRGAAGYLVKPFRGSTLLDAVRASIEAARTW
jgi:FixJ family two-component response regulator